MATDLEDKSKTEFCTCNTIHTDVVQHLKDCMLEEQTLQDVAELFKIFADSTRIKIIYSLFKSEMCVCDIAALLEMNQSAISHQLRVLKQSRLVKYRKEGKVVYYSLDDDHVKEMFHMALDHIKE